MKQVKHKFLLTLILTLCAISATADEFIMDGIHYQTYGNEAAVIYYYDEHTFGYSGDVIIPSTVTYDGTTYSVTSIGSWAFSECSGLASIILPNSITVIGSRAFQYCDNLTNITIPNSVISINDGAFECCGLKNVTIGNSVTSIGEAAFYGCHELTNIVIPNTVTSIGASALDGTGWYNNQPEGVIYAGLLVYSYKGTMPYGTSITIREGTSGITDKAFYGCNGLENIYIPNSVSSIGSSAFYGCSELKSINIPNSVITISNSTFEGCTGLNSIDLGRSVTSIGHRAFYGCNGIKGIVIPNSVTIIGGSAFYGCSGLNSVEIPNSVTIIGGSAFYGCSGLSAIEIGNTVNLIGGRAFYDCPSISNVTCLNETPPSCEGLDIFNNNVYNHAKLYVPKGCKAAYISDQSWGQFTRILAPGELSPDVDGDGVATISDVTKLIDYLLSGGQ